MTTFNARIGDWVELPEGPGHPHPRRGLVVALLHADGSPPYRVRWSDEEHETVIFPPPDAQLRRTTSGHEWRGGS